MLLIVVSPQGSSLGLARSCEGILDSINKSPEPCLVHPGTAGFKDNKEIRSTPNIYSTAVQLT